MDQYTIGNTTTTFAVRTARGGTAARWVLYFAFQVGGKTQNVSASNVKMGEKKGKNVNLTKLA